METSDRLASAIAMQLGIRRNQLYMRRKMPELSRPVSLRVPQSTNYFVTRLTALSALMHAMPISSPILCH